MTPNAAHPKPNAADTLPISTDMVSNDSETVPIGTDPSLISNSQQSPDIQVNPAVKSTGLNVSLSANRLPVAVREPPAKPQRSTAIVAAAASQSIRILVIVKRSEVGFEWLYDDLSRFDDDPQRSKHVKCLLLFIATGIDAASLPSIHPSTHEPTQRSYRISFRLSAREIGLEKLFNELCIISTPAARNLHVKRLIYNSRTVQTKVSPVIDHQTLSPSHTSTPTLALDPVLSSTTSSVPIQTVQTSTLSKSAENSIADTTGFGSLDTFTSWATEEETPVSNKDEKRSSSEMSLKRKSSVRGLGT